MKLNLNQKSNSRRSSVRPYEIVPLKEEGGHRMTMMPLRPTSHQGKEPFLVRYAEFAPKGNAIAYVDYDNNIWYKAGVMEQVRKTAALLKIFNLYRKQED